MKLSIEVKRVLLIVDVRLPRIRAGDHLLQRAVDEHRGDSAAVYALAQLWLSWRCEACRIIALGF